MKALLFSMVSAVMLISCGPQTKNVRFPNYAVVTALGHPDIEYQPKQTVCVHSTVTPGLPNNNGWTICTDGDIKDTTYTVKYIRNGVTKSALVKHRVGTIMY